MRFLDPKGHIIDGKVVPPRNGAMLDVEEPATGETFTSIPAGTSEDIAHAVSAARESFRRGDWSRAEPAHRGRVLFAFAQKIRELAEPLAHLETKDTGKPIVEARADIVGTAEILEYYAGLATKIAGQTMPLPGKTLGMILREPAGPGGASGSPWRPEVPTRK